MIECGEHFLRRCFWCQCGWVDGLGSADPGGLGDNRGWGNHIFVHGACTLVAASIYTSLHAIYPVAIGHKSYGIEWGIAQTAARKTEELKHHPQIIFHRVCVCMARAQNLSRRGQVSSRHGYAATSHPFSHYAAAAHNQIHFPISYKRFRVAGANIQFSIISYISIRHPIIRIYMLYNTCRKLFLEGDENWGI